jgi:hypothetical protein
MSHIDTLLSELQTERNRMRAELRRMEHAMKVVRSLSTSGPAGMRKPRRLSAAARARIAAAQRLRWAKVRQQQRRKAA